MTTRAKIRESALRRFADQGYAATSLSEIAADSGIKKPSLYTYYSSKQAMFLELMTMSAHEELAFATGRILRDAPLPDVLEDMLSSVSQRFDEVSSLRFWVRAVYMPPKNLAAEVGSCERGYYAGMESALDTALEKGLDGSAAKRTLLVRAYIGILKGLYAELLLRDPRNARATLAALWAVYHSAMTL